LFMRDGGLRKRWVRGQLPIETLQSLIIAEEQSTIAEGQLKWLQPPIWQADVEQLAIDRSGSVRTQP
jgi:hypothetical protein